MMYEFEAHMLVTEGRDHKWWKNQVERDLKELEEQSLAAPRTRVMIFAALALVLESLPQPVGYRATP